MSGPEIRFLERLLKAYPEQKEQFRAEPLSFHLSTGLRYTPDFVRFENGRMVCIEVKGPEPFDNEWQAYNNWNLARQMFPEARFEWWRENEDNSAFIPEHGTPPNPTMSEVR